MNKRTKNYYEILEIPVDANPDEIQQSYLTAKSAYSGDGLALYSLMTKDECENILELIDEAYTILSDPLKRRAYDEARGFNINVYSGYQLNITPPKRHQFENPQQESSPPPSSDNHFTAKRISKLVANKRFSLQYQVDPEMEKKIEETTEFTGEFLRNIREYKNVDMVRMSEMTKVSKTYLRHIEDEDFTKLPALVYVRGFVYQYAKCLKLNPDLVATSFLYRMKRLKGENE